MVTQRTKGAWFLVGSRNLRDHDSLLRLQHRDQTVHITDPRRAPHLVTMVPIYVVSERSHSRCMERKRQESVTGKGVVYLTYWTLKIRISSWGRSGLFQEELP